MPRVLIVTGPPGVGKTTTADILASRAPRGVHLESDSFFHYIRGGYVEPWKPGSQPQNEIVMGIVATAAAAYAAAGYVTVIDGIVSPRWFLRPLRDGLQAAGQHVAYVVLRAPLRVCVQRARIREPAGLRAPEVIEQLWQDFADLGDLERHVIDTDGRSAGEVAEQAARALQSGRLNV